ncbi:MAG: hypothetical protein H0T69_16285 [Thermoleophilaceae bacterium]|nr:hypothetical protein [Thermoleophilaceae bacterium]
MSLLLHHLAPDAKRAALTDACRVLCPGGCLHVADWRRPHGALPRTGFLALRLLHGFGGTRAHRSLGRSAACLAHAGTHRCGPRVAVVADGHRTVASQASPVERSDRGCAQIGEHDLVRVAGQRLAYHSVSCATTGEGEQVELDDLIAFDGQRCP